MLQPGRQFTKGSTYRYGFNGKEKDISIASDNYDFGSRIYDGRIGKWLSVDPHQAKYPDQTPYNFGGGNPVNSIDVNGRDTIKFWSSSTTYTSTGLDGMKFNYITSSKGISIIKAPGKDVFIYQTYSAVLDANGNITSGGKPNILELTPFSGGHHGITTTRYGSFPENLVEFKDDDFESLMKYMYACPALVNYAKTRTTTGFKETDQGWSSALNSYKLDGILNTAMKISSFTVDIAMAVTPLVGVSGAGVGVEYTTIYRTVDAAEAESLMSGKFSFGPNGSEMKQFWTNEEAYNSYIQAAGGKFANGYKVAIEVPKSVIGSGKTLNTAVQVDESLFQQGTINSATVNGQSGLDILNKVAKDIKITKE